MSPPQSRRESSRTALPDQSSQADRPSRKSPQAACPHQKNRIDPSYPHPRILSCELDSHKFSTAAIFRGALYNMRWDGHVVGKVGFASGQWMIFGTGGLAIADLNFQEGVIPPAPPPVLTGGKYTGF